MSQSIIGLDLGTYSIKFVEISRDFNKFEFLRAFEARIPQDDRITREEAQAIVIEEQIAQEIRDSKVIICAFPGHYASNRIIELPLSDRRKIERVIAFEIENHIPVDLDKILYDWEILAKPSSSNEVETKIAAVTIMKDQFNSYYRMLQSVGLDPRDITLDVIALGFLEKYAGVADDFAMADSPGAIVLIDCGHTKTNICIVADGSALYFRSVGIAGREFTRCLEKDYHLSFLEAETLKQTDGQFVLRSGPGVTPEAGKISKSLQRVADELAAEIRQTTVKFEQHFNHNLAECRIFGGSANIKNFAPYLSNHLNIPVKKHNYFIANGVTDFSEQQALSLQPALALALRGLQTKHQQMINFRKAEYQYAATLDTSTIPFRKIATWAAVLLLVVFIHFAGRSFLLSAEVKRLEKSIGEEVKKVVPNYQYREPQHALSVLRSKVSGTSGDANSADRVTKGKSPIVTFRDISNAIPKTLPVTLTDINIDLNTVRLKGITDSRESIAKIRENLSNVEGFGEASEDRAPTKSGNNLEFKLTISLGVTET